MLNLVSRLYYDPQYNMDGFEWFPTTGAVNVVINHMKHNGGILEEYKQGNNFPMIAILTYQIVSTHLFIKGVRYIADNQLLPDLISYLADKF